MASVSMQFPLGHPYPCLGDRHAAGGSTKGHYFHQDLLVAKKVFSRNPKIHVDVGSRIDGFVAHVAVFRQIEMFDIRPLPDSIPNIKFVRSDLMEPVSEALYDYCDSLSSLHALEHFGLGRYGDPVRHDGYLLALGNFHKILQKGGRLYLSVPIGPQRIEFNAHRVFSIHYLLDCMAGKFTVDNFSYIDDQGALHPDQSISSEHARNNFGCVCGCGIFEMTKR